MRITALGDIHMATSSLSEIEKLADSDLVLVIGDITNFGGRGEAREVLNDILSINKNLLCLAGNLDNQDVNDYLDDLGMNLHGQAHMVKRQACIFGVGGSNPTPFGTPWEFHEDDLQDIVREAHRQAKELIELAQPMVRYAIPLILVSHAPPYETKVDRLLNGNHVGSTAIRRFIETTAPDLCLTGHIHEAKGKDQIGTTKVVNLGMLQQGGWLTFTIDKNRIDIDI